MSKVKPKSLLCVASNTIFAQRNRKVLDINDEINIKGKVVVITGSNSGIGAVAAMEFAKRGAKVIMPNRDTEKAERVAHDIKAKISDADLVLLALDLGDLDSIRRCAADIRTLTPHINVLVNNAGIQNTDTQIIRTAQGFESNMGINYLGGFLFTNLLLDLMQATQPSRVVFTSSATFQFAELDVNDLMSEKTGPFGPNNLGLYSNSKLANMYNAYSLGQRLKEKNVQVYALDPGIVETNLRRSVTGFKKIMLPIENFVAQTAEEGAETILYCALSNKCANETGLMYRFNALWDGAMEEAIDEQTANTLWEISEKLVSQK